MITSKSLKYPLIILLGMLSMMGSAMHGGHTDSEGGHTNLLTNSGYHFHHGSSEHQHWLGYCSADKEFKSSEWVLILLIAGLYFTYYRFIRQRPIAEKLI